MRLSRLLTVDFSGGVKEVGVKAQRKKTNLSELWAPQPTYYGKTIINRSLYVKNDTVAP